MSKHDKLITPLSLYIASHRQNFQGKIFEKFFPGNVAYMPEIEKMWEDFFAIIEKTTLTNFDTVYDGLCHDLESRLDAATGQFSFNDDTAIKVESFEGCLKCLLHHKDATFFPESRLKDKDYIGYDTVKDLKQLCAISKNNSKDLYKLSKWLKNVMDRRNDISHPGSTTKTGEALEFYVRGFFTAMVMLPHLGSPAASVFVMCVNKSTSTKTDVRFEVHLGKKKSNTSKYGYVPFFLSNYDFNRNTELSLKVTAEANGFQKEERTITVKRGDYADRQNPTITIDLYDYGASPQPTGPQPTGPQSTGPQNTGPQPTEPQNTGPQNTGTQPKRPTGPTPPPPPPPFPKWIIAVIAGVLAAVIGLVLISTCSGSDSPSAFLSEQTEEGLPQMPPLDGNSWSVVQMEGQHMSLGTAGAEIHSMNNNGTDLRMGVLNDYGAYHEISLTYDRQTGQLLSPELGEGHVEKDERMMKLKIVFEGWLLEKMY